MPGTGPTVQSVQLCQVFLESTFGTDITGSLGSFLPVPFQEASQAVFTLGRNMQDPQTVVQYHHDYREEVFGPKSWTLRFTMALAPTGTAAGSATAAVQGCLGYLLAAVMGGEDLGTGSTFSSGWTAVTGDVASGTGFSKGTAVGWVNTAGIYEMRPLKNVATNTLTNKLAFSGSPANSNVAYSCASYYLTSDPDASLQFVVRGLESQDEFVLMGGQLDSMTINLPLDGTPPTIAFAFKGVKWIYGADAAGSASFTDITPATFSNFAPIAGHAGEFLTQVNGTTTYAGSTVNVSQVTFAPALTYKKIPSPSGVEGVLRWRLMRNNGPSITGSYTTYFESTARMVDRDDKDDRLIWYQCGQSPGNSFALEAGTVQYGDPQRIDDAGTAAEMVPWKGRRDGDISSASGDQQLSPFRIHLG
jgi:hypothetical protein